MADPKRLVANLTPAVRHALERAAEHALRETHAAIEPEHLLLEMFGAADCDIAYLLAIEAIDPAPLHREIMAAIGMFTRGSPRMPALSGELLDTLTAAWTIASVDHALPRMGSACILRACFDNMQQRMALLAAIPALAPVFDSGQLRDLQRLLAEGPEQLAAVAGGGPPGGSAAGATRADSALAAYTIDLTALAQAGKIDPVVGRDAEIRQLVDVLMRRQQNNPILVGAAGVGKTAIVEGFASRIVAGLVPPRLARMHLRSLDLGLLQAGASARGEYEQRLRAVLDEAAATTPRTVLFIDEAHMLIGAGGTAGQADAANLLKPALARGGLGVIAATTWSEYKRYFEKDGALTRRFQTIRVGEPSEAVAIEMLRGIAPRLEAHHGVRVLEEALGEAVRLSHRYIAARQLPEKAISVLDTACARLAISRGTPPVELETTQRRATSLAEEIARLRHEAVLNNEHGERLETLEAELEQAREQVLRLTNRWELERQTLARMTEIEAEITAEDTATHSTDAAGRDLLRQEWGGLELELREVQEGAGPIGTSVDSRSIAEVIAGWTGIPAGRMLSDSLSNARALKPRMMERIVGQNAAIDTICRRIQTFYADLGEPNKPTGVFMLCGPSGVGKTETALTLADLLFGGQRALVTVNMTEYQEAHTVSALRGAPPGYVGYGSGGVLTEAVRRQPYCVLLLDEIEKAHPDVIELFYQVFDRGMLEDSEGQLVDFTHTVILLTSNVGADALAERARLQPHADARTLEAAIRPELTRHFPAAFLGRLVVVPYHPLTQDGIEAVTRLKLDRIRARFAMTRRGELTYHDDLVRLIAEQAGATASGARMVDSILTQSVLPELSGRILDRVAEGETITGAHLGVAADGGLAIALRP